MIDLAYDTSTDSVRLVRAVTIKAGSPGVPVRLTFSSVPTKTVSDIQIALGTEGASPTVLAFNEDFTAESSTVWTAILDANDTRLVNYMNGRKQADTNAELVLFLDGERQAYQNITVTVQPPVINGPETTEGGPVYLTESNADARYAQPIIPNALNLVAEGDSITHQQPSPNGGWAEQLVTMPAFAGKATCRNVAANGDTLAGLVSEYASEVAIYKPATTGIPGWLFVRIGSNDLINGVIAPNVATWVASLEAYWAQAKADGFTVVAFTITPRMDYPSTEPTRITANQLIRKSVVFDYLIDADALFPDYADTTIYSDGAHPTSLGNELMARAIDSMFSGTGLTPEVMGHGVVTRLVSNGDVTIQTAGKGLKIKEGSNARMGTATLSSGVATIANTSVTANTRVFLTRQDFGASSALGPVLALNGYPTPGVGFSIRAATTAGVTESGDNGVIAWMLVEPA